MSPEKQSFMLNSQSRSKKNQGSIRRQEKMEQIENINYISRSLKKPSNLLDTSFEFQVKNKHADAVQDASIDFLKTVYSKSEFALQKGFNTFQFFGSDKSQGKYDQQLFQIIRKNTLLNSDQINQFIVDISSEQELKKLLENLSEKFPQNIFHEIVFVYSCAWEKYLQIKTTMKLSSTMKNMNLPTLLNLNQISEENYDEDQYYQLSISEIEKEVSDVTEQISGTIYLNKNIKYINLMEAELEKKRMNVREYFSQFIKVIVKTLFFVLEGYYEDPGSQEEQIFSLEESQLNQSSSDQENQLSKFDLEEKPIKKRRKIE